MKILYATPGYKPAFRIGGPIISVAGLAENLVQRGHEVVVFTSNSNLDQDLDVPVNQPVMVNGVEVWYFEHEEPFKKYVPFIPYLSESIGYLYLPSLAKTLKQRIREFDLVHTHMPFVYPTYAVAKAAIENGIPVFYQQRGAFAPAYLQFRSLKKHIYISLIEKPIMKRAAILIALTETEVKSYRALGINTVCRVIPNGIDVTDYLQEIGGELKLADQFLIGSDDILLLFLARLHEIKGADFLIDVFLDLFAKYPKLKLVMAGPDQHNLKGKLNSKITNAGVKDSVLILDMIEGARKRDLLARADLFCLPSKAEGFSVSILEAMASATPVMATPECNFPSLEEKSAGWVVKKNQGAWVDKISYLLENPSEFRVKKKNAFNLVKYSYTWEKVVDDLERVYAEGLPRAFTKKSKNSNENVR